MHAPVGDWKTHDELSARAGPGAVRRNLSAVQLDKTPRHIESNPQPAAVPVMPEGVEDVRTAPVWKTD
jgi:hypothetical protein